VRIRKVPQRAAGHRVGAVRLRGAAVATIAAALPLTAITISSAPASAAAGYTVTGIGVGGYPAGVAVDPTTVTAYVTNNRDDVVSVISPDGDPQAGRPPFGVPVISSGNHAAFRPDKHASFTVRADGRAATQRFTLRVS
jgi:hypothetical protein